MGDHWWLWLGGGAMWLTMMVCAVRGARRPATDACPQCAHEAGLDGNHCAKVDDYNGWSTERCRCQNDYHWNYESITAA